MCWEDFLAGLEVSFCSASEKELGHGVGFFGGVGNTLYHLCPRNPTV